MDALRAEINKKLNQKIIRIRNSALRAEPLARRSQILQNLKTYYMDALCGRTFNSALGN